MSDCGRDMSALCRLMLVSFFFVYYPVNVRSCRQKDDIMADNKKH